MSNLRINILCIYHPHFALFIHIEPITEEQELVIQEPSEEHVLQQPQEEQQQEEPQPGYDYIPEAAAELTSDPHEQGRHA